MQSVLYNYTPDELQELLNKSCGYADVLRTIGLNPKGGNQDTLKKVIAEYNLDVAQLDSNRKKPHSRKRISTEDILNGKYPNYQSSKLLKRLVNEGYKEYRCERCGIFDWMNSPISLQLHHIDGNHSNHKLENLQILCPNCHTQTDSYSGKSSQKIKIKKESSRDKPTNNDSNNAKKKSPPITRDELKAKIRSIPFIKIGKEYGVSDNAVRKWCDKYGLPRRSREIHNYSDKEWENI